MSKPNLRIRVEVKASVIESEDDPTYGLFEHAQAHFYSTPNKEFVRHLLDTGQSTPNINCSRDGTKCATPLTELQIHNSHVPVHYDFDNLKNYVERMLEDIVDATEKLGVSMSVSTDDAFYTKDNDNDKV